LYFSKDKTNFNKRSACLILGIMAALFIFSVCYYGYVKGQSPILEGILKAGEITVCTRNNAHCYYLYREQAMGFEYDLAKAFADHLGVKLKVRIAEKWDGMIPALMKGTGSFIAASMTIMPKRKELVSFSNAYMPIQQYVIVHRDNRSIRYQEDLAGKTVHVREGTSYEERLKSLKNKGIDLEIKLHDDLSTEELIRQVAGGKIEVTIADSNIALLNQRYYPQAVLACPISEQEFLGWAVNRNAQNLLYQINCFFKTIKENGKFNEIYNKYYANIDDFDFVDLRAYHRRLKSRLPKYKKIVMEAADYHGFDWRLIAAQIYQESHFKPNARSSSGARGLMQLTLSTARSLGVKEILNPEQNINAGVQHLKALYNYFAKAKGINRLFLALAAYNVGQGHILDAQNIAREMNLDPNKWSSLSITLPLLTYQKHYKKARYGYCRGTEPIEYINKVMMYYDILKRQGIEYNTYAESKLEGKGG
jgi:membrane-bound lytic murein transglycosylase F